MNTMAYKLWKNTIRYFQLSGRQDDLLIPITYQSMEADVAHMVLTFRLQLNLCQLISHLDDSFRVISDEHTLTKELYSIKQGLRILLTAMTLASDMQ